MKKNQVLIIDFDSTLTQVEALDELAAITLRNNPKRGTLVAKIKEITNAGMNGSLSIEESLNQRIKLIKPSREQIEQLAKLLKRKITPSFARNGKFLKKNSKNIFIVTSGFKEYVLPVVKQLGLKTENVLANSFLFDKKGKVVDFDRKNPLSQKLGKVKAIKALKLKGEISVIGDGFTDYEIKKAGIAQKFYAFVENVSRESVLAVADQVLKSFDEFLFMHKIPGRFSYPKSKMQALLLEGVHPDGIAHLKEQGYSVDVLPDALSEAELSKRLSEVSILGVRSKTQVTKEVLKGAPKLMAVGAFCIGTEQIDLDACSERGIIVFNAPYSNTRSVVELALGEIIVLMRRTFEASSKLHQGVWAKSASGSFEIRGKKLGIVGYGNIGSQLSVLAEVMGLEVYYYDVVEKLALGNAKKCKTLDELLKVSDIITLHVDGRGTNKNMIGPKQFSQMKDGVIFLNLSRGAVVNLGALAAALKSGKVAGAAIDVYPKEPHSNKEKFVSELCGLSNVILTPHVGGSTLEAQRNISEYVASRFIDYIDSGSSFMSVNFPQIQLPTLQHAHRLLHVHKNVPGILAEINGILAKHRINILGQYLKTTEQIGYVITDVNKKYDNKVVDALKKIKHTIKFRVLY